MLDWGEAGPEERKKFIMVYAIAATIIVIGSIAAAILGLLICPYKLQESNFLSGYPVAKTYCFGFCDNRNNCVRSLVSFQMMPVSEQGKANEAIEDNDDEEDVEDEEQRNRIYR